MNAQELLEEVQKIVAVNPRVEVVMEIGFDRMPVRSIKISDEDAPGVMPLAILSPSKDT